MTDGRAYVLPARFIVPALCGDAGTLDGLTDLNDLQDAVLAAAPRPDTEQYSDEYYTALPDDQKYALALASGVDFAKLLLPSSANALLKSTPPPMWPLTRAWPPASRRERLEFTHHRGGCRAGVCHTHGLPRGAGCAGGPGRPGTDPAGTVYGLFADTLPALAGFLVSWQAFFSKNFIYQPDSCFGLKNLVFYGLNCLFGTLFFRKIYKEICFYKNLIVDSIDLIICVMMSDQIADSLYFCFIVL